MWAGWETFQAAGPAAPPREARRALPPEVEIIGQSPVMKRILEMLPEVAASEVSVVLEGESGTGKDLLPRAIHLKSSRARGPFVAFSCSALVETLMESELFGHVRAAFLPGPSATRWAGLKWPGAAPCFWTKSGS